jgi:hypothetical protein
MATTAKKKTATKPTPKAAAKKKPAPPVKKAAPKPAPAPAKAPARPAPKLAPVAAPAKGHPVAKAAPVPAKAQPVVKPGAAKPALPPAKGAVPAGKAPAPQVKGAVAAPVPGAKPGVPGAKPGVPGAKPGAPAPTDAQKKKAAKKSARRMLMRRGPDGELLAPGELLLPGGVQHIDEVLYMLRGSLAAEHPAPDEALAEVAAKKKPETVFDEAEIARQREQIAERFETSQIESLLPVRPPGRRTFQGVVERAKHRRREIGSFLRGLDLGRTETSHMDSHGEASLQSLMEWAARLEVLAEADEPENADYGQFLRVLDQLDNTTESLVVDVELTLRRLRDRVRAAQAAKAAAQAASS